MEYIREFITEAHKITGGAGHERAGKLTRGSPARMQDLMRPDGIVT